MFILKEDKNQLQLSPGVSGKNLVTREDCISFDPASFLEFENSFKDDVLKATIGEANGVVGRDRAYMECLQRKLAPL